MLISKLRSKEIQDTTKEKNKFKTEKKQKIIKLHDTDNDSPSKSSVNYDKYGDIEYRKPILNSK